MTASALALNSDRKDVNRPRRWIVFSMAWLLFSLLTASWSFATPIAASPDEPAHIVKAASVVRGQLVGEASFLGHVVQVPRYIASTQSETCFAFKPDVTADCAAPLPGAGGDIVDGTTTAGLYNPVYYALVGWPSLLTSDASGIYAMRIVSGVLTSLFLAFSAMLACSWTRNRLPLAAIALATPPMVLFLAGSVNPNGIETATTLAVFTGMLTISLRPDPAQLTERSMIVLAAAALAVNSRGLSPLWIAFAVLLPLILLNWSQIRALLGKPAVLTAAGGTALAAAFAVFWLMHSSSLTSAINNQDSFQQFPGVGESSLTGFTLILRETLGYAQDMIGNFGWLDTAAPQSVYFVWSVFVGALLIAAFALLRGRALLLAITLTAAFTLVPAIIQGFYVTGGGLIWQGRYALPLFTYLVFGVAALVSVRIGSVPRPVMRRLALFAWSCWAIAQYFSFAFALRRYSVGFDGAWRDLLFAAEWNAPGGNLLWLGVFAALLAVTGWLGWQLGEGGLFGGSDVRPIRLRAWASGSIGVSFGAAGGSAPSLVRRAARRYAGNARRDRRRDEGRTYGGARTTDVKRRYRR